MNIFKVESNSVAYDEDDSMVIVAGHQERALNIAKKNWKFREGRHHDNFTVSSIDLLEEKIIHIAHYGE